MTKKFFVFVAVASGILFSQYYFDRHKLPDTGSSLFTLPAPVIKTVDLGLHSAAASFAWLSIIQNLNSPRITNLDQDINVVTLLDPKFSYPYAFGILFLPTLGKAQGAIDLGIRGLAHSEPDWRIPYYLATVYHQSFQDSVNAEKYFAVAAGMPGAPETAKFLAGVYGAKASRREQTKAIWQGIYDTSRDEVTRERAFGFLEHLAILDLLDQASAAYKKKTGKFPTTVEDLIGAHILKEAPVSALGFQYSFDKEGKVIIKLASGENTSQ